MRRSVAAAFEFGRRKPLLLGETGLHIGSDYTRIVRPIIEDFLGLADEEGWSYCLWNYKDVGAMGLLSPAPDTPWREFLAAPPAATARATAATLYPVPAKVDGPLGLLRDTARRLATGFDALALSFAHPSCREHPVTAGLLDHRA